MGLGTGDVVGLGGGGGGTRFGTSIAVGEHREEGWVWVPGGGRGVRRGGRVPGKGEGGWVPISKKTRVVVGTFRILVAQVSVVFAHAYAKNKQTDDVDL